MGNLGFQYAYHLFNSIEGCVAERAFLPEPELMGEYETGPTPLFSYESQRPVAEFDIIAFSVSFEDDYFNIPKILRLARVPVPAAERSFRSPLVIAGGAAVTLNPEPVASLIDLFLVGESEGVLGPFLDMYKGAAGEEGRSGLLARLDALESAYVPSLYSPAYEGARFTGLAPEKGAKAAVRAAKNLDLKGFELPRTFISTPESSFKDTFLAEIGRGCGRGCRFCAAGFIYLPPRFRDPGAVDAAVAEGMDATGKVGLVGTAVSEYPGITGVLARGLEVGEKGAPGGKGGKPTMTLSSLRLDCLDAGFLEKLKRAGYRTVTMAPEAGSLKMRKVVNKGMDDEEIISSARLVSEAGFTRLKLYFLIGLPGEEDTDAGAVVELTRRIREVMKSGTVALSVNPFVPKPSTPFQWHPFERVEVLKRRLKIIRDGLKRCPGVTVKSMAPKEAFVQAYISRADRRAGAFVLEASEQGVKGALKAHLEEMEEEVYRARPFEEALPWDHIDHGLIKGYLWTEYERGLHGALTPPCNVGACTRCGVC